MFASICLLFLLQEGNFAIDERFRVEFVTLDILARAKNGELVTDLKQQDFVVTENGKKVDISFFQILDLGGSSQIERAEDQPEEVKARRPSQQIVLALDLESAKPVEAQKALEQTKAFIESLNPSLNYRVNLYSMERGSLTKGFTQSKAELLNALHELRERNEAARHRRSGRDGDGESRILRDNDGPNLSLGTQRPGSSGLLLASVNNLIDLENVFAQCGTLYGERTPEAQNCIYASLSDYKEELENRTRRMIGELELLAYHFEQNEGLKLMMLISPGFPVTNLNSADELAQIYATSGQNTSTVPAFSSSSRFDFDDEFQRIVHACVKNRVIFHTFDIFNADMEGRRLGVEFSGRASNNVGFIYRRFSQEISSGLRELADQSGGSFSQLSNFGMALTTQIERSKLFYVIGYTSPEGKPGKYRKIKVKTKSGIELEYRKGYYGR